MLVEVTGGWIAHSLALIADAGHMLTDAAALSLAWFAVRLARKPSDLRRSYGYQRLTVLAAFVNGILLIAAVIWIVIEAVGRPEAWEWAIDMARKGGTVNFFGGCASGTKVALDTNRLHYSEITLKATFHHTPETVRKAFALIAERKIRGADYITGEAPLSRLQQVLRHMLNRNGDIKTAIIPGH